MTKLTLENHGSGAAGMLDLVVDPRSQEIRPNPRSPDAPMYDMLGVVA